MLELFHQFTIKSNSNNLEVRFLLYRLNILQLMNEGVKSVRHSLSPEQYTKKFDFLPGWHFC